MSKALIASKFLNNPMADEVGFLQSGVGAVSRNSQDKMRECVSVKDFGAVGNSITDDSTAFANAIASLPVTGGKITVPYGIYLLNNEPNWGNKSIYWDINPSAVFVGAGTGENKFPYQKLTNGGQMAVGPWIQSNSSQHSTHPNGGIAAFQIEMLQPADYGSGQSVALYLGARGSCPDAAANVWALNPLIHVDPTAGGTYQCIEVDVDNFSPTALVKGISISGVGTVNPDVALEIIRADATNWESGINIRNSITGIKIEAANSYSGIVIGEPNNMPGLLIGKQYTDNADCIVLQRASDVLTNGYFLRGVNQANNTTLFSVDVNANAKFNILTSTNLRASVGAVAVATNELGIGSAFVSSATAGGATSLPASPLGYLTWYHGATPIRIPFYNA